MFPFLSRDSKETGRQSANGIRPDSRRKDGIMQYADCQGFKKLTFPRHHFACSTPHIKSNLREAFSTAGIGTPVGLKGSMAWAAREVSPLALYEAYTWQAPYCVLIAVRFGA